MKQAQEEAEAEVNRYKQEREAQFQAWITQNSSGSSDITASLEKDTKAQLEAIARETDTGMFLNISSNSLASKDLCRKQCRTSVYY